MSDIFDMLKDSFEPKTERRIGVNNALTAEEWYDRVWQVPCDCDNWLGYDLDEFDTEEEAEEHVYELDKAGKTGIELTNFVEIWKFKNGEWE